MTVKNVYDEIDGNYDEIMGRMNSEEFIATLLGMFLQDESYGQLTACMESENYQDAFRAAHNMKGLCANISMSGLGGVAEEITEALRDGKDVEKAKALMPVLTERYQKTVETIKRFQEEK